MAVIVIGDVLEYRIVTLLGDQVGLNVRHLKVTQLIGLPTTQQTVDALEPILSTPIKPLMSAQAEFRGIDLRVLLPTPSTVVFNNSDAGFGTVAGEDLPKQVAGVLSLRTDTPGRSGRGRMYVSFPSEIDSESPGRPIAGYVIRLTTLGVSIKAPLIVDDLIGNSLVAEAAVLQGGQLPPNATKLITSAIARPFWGTQRRRGDFGAKNVPPI